MPRKGYKGLNLSIPNLPYRMIEEIINKTSESKGALVVRLVEKEYSILINGEDPYVEYTNKMEHLNNSIMNNIVKLDKHKESVIDIINSNIIALNENNKLLTRILNVCNYSFARIFKFITLSLYYIIGYGDKKEDIHNYSKHSSHKATQKLLSQLKESMDGDSNSLLNSLVEEKEK